VSDNTFFSFFNMQSDHGQVNMTTVGMTDLLDMLVRFNRHHRGGRALPSRNIMFSFAQSWRLISAVLSKRRALLSTEEILKHAQAHSQMVKLDE